MTTLPDIIQRFADANPHYGRTLTAWGRCDAATYNFIRFAREHGYEGPLEAYTFYATYAEEIKHQSYEDNTDQTNPDPRTYVVVDEFGQDLRNDEGVTMCHWHCIVDAGHILIDFTARQYRAHYAFPHVIAIEDTLHTTRDRAMAAGVGSCK